MIQQRSVITSTKNRPKLVPQNPIDDFLMKWWNTNPARMKEIISNAV